MELRSCCGARNFLLAFAREISTAATRSAPSPATGSGRLAPQIFTGYRSPTKPCFVGVLNDLTIESALRAWDEVASSKYRTKQKEAHPFG